MMIISHYINQVTTLLLKWDVIQPWKKDRIKKLTVCCISDFFHTLSDFFAQIITSLGVLLTKKTIETFLAICDPMLLGFH